MPNWNNLTSKVIQTVEADGILGLGKRGGRYLKKRFGALAKKESDPVFKDVLFIDGCGTVLPHPSRISCQPSKRTAFILWDYIRPGVLCRFGFKTDWLV